MYIKNMYFPTWPRDLFHFIWSAILFERGRCISRFISRISFAWILRYAEIPEAPLMQRRKNYCLYIFNVKRRTVQERPCGLTELSAISRRPIARAAASSIIRWRTRRKLGWRGACALRTLLRERNPRWHFIDFKIIAVLRRATRPSMSMRGTEGEGGRFAWVGREGERGTEDATRWMRILYPATS